MRIDTRSDEPAPVENVKGRGRITRALIILLTIGALSAIAFVLWQQFGPRPGARYGVVINASKPIDDFRLDSTLGHPVALSDFDDRYTVLYFGYTTCPDICPTTLADLGKAEQLLGDVADRVQMIFVTVDPERDTPERMRDYLAFFGDHFVGLSGSLEDTEMIAGQFGVVYEKQMVSQSATDYLIDHSSVVVVLDPERRPLVMFPFGVTAEQIAADIQAVMR